MRLGRHVALFAAIAALLGAAVCIVMPAAAASAATVGWVRCANLSPGTPAVDIYLISFGNPGHSIVLKHAGYGEVYSYMPVSTGEYTVAMRPVGAPASSSPIVSTSFMVSAGANYTVASLGPASGRRLEVLKDDMTASSGKALVRVIQASLKQDMVTVTDGKTVLAQQLVFGAVTPYVTVRPGAQNVQFTAAGAHTAKSITLTAGSVHTIVVLDGSSGLAVDNLTDAAGSPVAPTGGAGTGLGGTAPRDTAPDSAPWVATLSAGLLLIMVGLFVLRRSRRSAAVVRE
jgi:Domain of unknown function (DUF4397)